MNIDGVIGRPKLKLSRLRPHIYKAIRTMLSIQVFPHQAHVFVLLFGRQTIDKFHAHCVTHISVAYFEISMRSFTPINADNVM